MKRGYMPDWYDPPKGEASPSAKITERTAQAVLDAKGSMTGKQCACELGVGLATVWMIWSGRRWKHLRRDAKPQAADSL